MKLGSIARRDILRSLTLGGAGLAVAAVAACTQTAAPTPVSQPKTSSFKWPYEKEIETDIDGRAVMASPSLSNTSTYFAQANNWLTSIEKDYGYDPAKIRLVMANYGPMNFITYNDAIWTNYKAGEWQQVNDPQTKQPATKNPFMDDIKKLQGKHCVFLT